MLARCPTDLAQVLPEQQVLLCLICRRRLKDRVRRLLLCSVTKGSVLGPRLYSADLADKTAEHRVAQLLTRPAGRPGLVGLGQKIYRKGRVGSSSARG